MKEMELVFSNGAQYECQAELTAGNEAKLAMQITIGKINLML